MPVNVRIPDDLRDGLDAIRLAGRSPAEAVKREPFIRQILRDYVRTTATARANASRDTGRGVLRAEVERFAEAARTTVCVSCGARPQQPCQNTAPMQVCMRDHGTTHDDTGAPNG